MVLFISLFILDVQLVARYLKVLLRIPGKVHLKQRVDGLNDGDR